MKTIDWSNDGMFRNTSDSAWSSTTYYADNSVSDASRGLRAGGYWSSSTGAGAFYVYYAIASSASAYIGARLMFL